jgi:hypothetical protein
MTENEKKLLNAAKQLNDLCKSQYDVITNVKQIWKLTTQIYRLVLNCLNERNVTDQEMSDFLEVARSSIQAQRTKK